MRLTVSQGNDVQRNGAVCRASRSNFSLRWNVLPLVSSLWCLLFHRFLWSSSFSSSCPLNSCFCVCIHCAISFLFSLPVVLCVEFCYSSISSWWWCMFLSSCPFFSLSPILSASFSSVCEWWCNVTSIYRKIQTRQIWRQSRCWGTLRGKSRRRMKKKKKIYKKRKYPLTHKEKYCIKYNIPRKHKILRSFANDTKAKIEEETAPLTLLFFFFFFFFFSSLQSIWIFFSSAYNYVTFIVTPMVMSVFFSSSLPSSSQFQPQ